MKYIDFKFFAEFNKANNWSGMTEWFNIAHNLLYIELYEYKICKWQKFEENEWIQKLTKIEHMNSNFSL